MPGKSSKTQRVSIRLSNATIAEIQRLIKESPAQPACSVTEYCQNEIERYVWRHSTRKYKRPLV